MRVSTLLTVLSLAACQGDGGPDGPSFPRACDQSTIDGDCVEYTGAEWTESDVQAECTQGEIRDRCPTLDRVEGRCVIDEGTPFETISWFYKGYWDARTAPQACQGTDNAVWRSS